MDTKVGMAVCLVFLVMATVLSVLILPVFKVQEITVNGNTYVSDEDIISVLDGGIGTNILAFNTGKSRENIMTSFYYVKDVTVKKTLKKVTVDVQEYRLRAYVPYMGSYLYIDGEGRILDIQNSFTQQLPVVEGLEFSAFTLGEKLTVRNPGAFGTVVQLSKLFDKYDLAGNVVKVDVSDITNVHLYVGKIDVEFGDFTNANEKIVTIIEIIKNLDINDAGVVKLTNNGGSFEYLT